MSTPNTANSTGFHLKYRPRVLEDIVGHEQAVKTLQGFISTKKYPSAVLFAGPTSVGKTTMARAFAASLSGVPTVEAHSDFLEVNAGDKRTIDDVRNLIGLARNRPMRLPRRFIMLDEAQQLLSNSQAASCGGAKTPVITDKGTLTLKEIHDKVQAGETIYVLSYNHVENKPEFKRVKASRAIPNTKPMMRSGESTFTDDHRIWDDVVRSYVPLRTFSGNGLTTKMNVAYSCKVDFTTSVNEGVVYDIEVEDNENFFAVSNTGPVLVHNCLLGPLESPVPSTMWLLTSMELDKLMGTSVGKAMLNRCTLIKLSPHTPADFYKQAVRIVKGEQIRAFTKETLTALSEIPGLEMRTLSNTLQTLSGFLEGREEKLTVDELAELLVKVEARENDVDAAVVRYLISAYNGKVGPALKEILDVDDVFVFLMRAQTLNRAVLFKYTLGDIRHSKVWMTKPAQVMLAQVTKNVADDAAGRKEMLRRMTGVHSAITNARNALTVDVDGLIALTNSLVQ